MKISAPQEKKLIVLLDKWRFWKGINVTQEVLYFICSSGAVWLSSSSIDTTAHCGLWPVEQCPSIFSYLPPTLSIFSLPAHEDLFLLPLSIFSWVFPLLLVPSSFWAKMFLGTLSSFILSRWPNQLILCLFIHVTIFLLYSSLLVLDSSDFSIPRFHI